MAVTSSWEDSPVQIVDGVAEAAAERTLAKLNDATRVFHEACDDVW
jgi:hypothetical protein